MRSFSLLCLTLASASAVSAQYFSEGWAPGQPAHAPAATQDAASVAGDGDGIWEHDADADDSVPVPAAPPVFQETEEWAAWEPPLASPNVNEDKEGKKKKKDGEGFLASELSISFFNSLGINITEKLGKLESAMLWDERVLLLDDDNFAEYVVEEQFGEGDGEVRVWVVVVSASAGKQGGVPKFVDDAFDAAYNATLIADDLKHVRWARIDYLDVTYLTTKWSLWRAPMIMFITDRGQTLRFVGPNEMRLRNEGLRDALLDESWKRKAPWKSSFAPGGSNEYILEFLAIWMAKIYNWTIIVPKWMMYIASGSIASFVLSFMHRGDSRPARATANANSPPTTAGASTNASTPATTNTVKASASAVEPSPSKKSAKKRKAGGSGQ